MNPMSRRKRWIYLALCYALFIGLLPAVSLYASGFRVSGDGGRDGLAVVRTGGIAISVSEGASSIFVNGDPVKRLSVFGREFFIQNLRPAMYEVEVSKEGFAPWRKNMIAREGYVSVNSALLLPEEIESEALDTAVSTSTAEKISALFETDEQKPPKHHYGAGLGSALRPLVKDDTAIWRDGRALNVSWKGASESRPYFFCVYGNCRKSYTAFMLPAADSRVEFFPGRADTVLVLLKDGLYAVGLDQTPPRFIRRLYEGKGFDFRVSNGRVYVKDNGEIKRIIL